jgi:hypothetical protein
MTLFSFFVPKSVEIVLLILKEAQNYGSMALRCRLGPTRRPKQAIGKQERDLCIMMVSSIDDFASNKVFLQGYEQPMAEYQDSPV